MFNVLPRLTDETDLDLFDDVFKIPTFHNETLMKMDVVQNDDKYTMKMNLPGVKKEDIQISLNNGNLCVSATRNELSDTKDEQGSIIHQERFIGTTQRCFYVGNTVKQEDIHANFSDGILTIDIPNRQDSNEIEQRK